MNKYLVTFDYSSMTDPETGEEFSDEPEAADQFVAEISHARAFDGWDDLVGYRLLDRDAARRRWVVQFVVESADEETFDRDIQKWLFDENGMSGNYIIGREIPFMVTVHVCYDQTTTIYAPSEIAANEAARVRAARSVLARNAYGIDQRCMSVEVYSCALDSETAAE